MPPMSRREAIKQQMDRYPDHELHGTRTGYGYYKCRCPKCRLANADAVAEFRERQRRIGYSMAWEHGTYSTYSNHLCRCRPCTEAAVKYNASPGRRH